MGKGLLPKIKPEIISSVIRDYERDNLYFANLTQRLTNENPCILQFIDEMSDMSNNPKYVLETSLLVYRLLESQAEADKLNEDYKNQ